MTGVQVSRVPAARVKCTAIPSQPTRPRICEAYTPVGPPSRALCPRPRPGPHASRTPHSGPRRPDSPTGSVASPLSPPPPPQRPQRPHAPHVPSRPAAAPVPAVAVAVARPPPSLCRRRSEPHTHRYTQPLTSPGPRPAHVTAETRLPADAAAVSGRPGDSEGGGRGRGGNEASGAARPRASQSLGRARRLAYCGSLLSARFRLRAPLRPRQRRAPDASDAHARAPVSRSPAPSRACPALLAGPARRLGGWRTALSAVPGADRMFPRPHPRRPPSFLESPSRLSGAAPATPAAVW